MAFNRTKFCHQWDQIALFLMCLCVVFLNFDIKEHTKNNSLPLLLQNKSEAGTLPGTSSCSCSLADGKLLLFVIQKLSMITINLWS